MSRTHLVIARFKEPLDWLSLLTPSQRSSVWIYNKGGEAEEAPLRAMAALFGIPAHQVVSLPNVGRESHTYLSHVIAEYDRLPERILFVQGNPFDHLRPVVSRDAAGISAWYNAWCADIDAHGITVSNLINSLSCRDCPPGHELTAPEWRIHEWAGPLEPATEALGPWMRRHVGLDDSAPRGRLLWYMGACFGISRQCAARRPRAYYENLRDQVSTRNPEAGHFMERSWFYIFSGLNTNFETSV